MNSTKCFVLSLLSSLVRCTQPLIYSRFWYNTEITVLALGWNELGHVAWWRRDRGFERECWDGGTCPCWFPVCEEHRGNGKKGCCWCRVGLLVSSWMSVRILWFFVATKTKMWMWHWSPHDSDNTYEPILFIIIQSSY